MNRDRASRARECAGCAVPIRAGQTHYTTRGGVHYHDECAAQLLAATERNRYDVNGRATVAGMADEKYVALSAVGLDTVSGKPVRWET